MPSTFEPCRDAELRVTLALGLLTRIRVNRLLPLLLHMLDMALRHVLLGRRQHRADILAAASAADELRHQMHRQRAVLAAEPPGDLPEVEVLVMAAIQAEAVDPQPGIDDRADRDMLGGIELFFHAWHLAELSQTTGHAQAVAR